MSPTIIGPSGKCPVTSAFSKQESLGASGLWSQLGLESEAKRFLVPTVPYIPGFTLSLS